MKSIPYCPIARKKRYSIQIPKSEWKRYRPDRYLYHLNFRGNKIETEDDLFLNRVSFVKEGICGVDWGLGGVWANNQIRKINQLWPICYDSWGLNLHQYLKFIQEFDVWQIDTSLINNTWYVDPNLIDEPFSRSGEAEDYLYCEYTIHPRALRLFTIFIDEKRCLENKEFNNEFKLIPEKKINELIRYKWMNKYP
jgi:hypothetical protein